MARIFLSLRFNPGQDSGKVPQFKFNITLAYKRPEFCFGIILKKNPNHSQVFWFCIRRELEAPVWPQTVSAAVSWGPLHRCCWVLPDTQSGECPPATPVPPQPGAPAGRGETLAGPSAVPLAAVSCSPWKTLLVFQQGTEGGMEECPGCGWEVNEAGAFLPAQKQPTPRGGERDGWRELCGAPSHRALRRPLYSQILWTCKNATGENPSPVEHLQHPLLRSFNPQALLSCLVNFWIAEPAWRILFVCLATAQHMKFTDEMSQSPNPPKNNVLQSVSFFWEDGAVWE